MIIICVTLRLLNHVVCCPFDFPPKFMFSGHLIFDLNLSLYSLHCGTGCVDNRDANVAVLVDVTDQTVETFNFCLVSH